MQTEIKSKGMWVHRFAIRLCTVVLGVLFYWLLRFVVQDVQSIPGPDFASLELRYVQPAQREEQAALDKQIAELTRQIDNQKEKRRVVGDSSQNLQQTITQLLELQKLGIQKSLPLSETEQANFTSTLNLFLENQRKYQELSQAEAELLERKQGLVQDQQQRAQEMERLLAPARAEYETSGLAASPAFGLLAVGDSVADPGRGGRGHRPQAQQHLFSLVPGLWCGNLGEGDVGDARVFSHSLLQVHPDRVAPAGGRGALGLLHSQYCLSESAVAGETVPGGLRTVLLSGLRISHPHRTATVSVLDAEVGEQAERPGRPGGAGRGVHLSGLRQPVVRGLRSLPQDPPHAAAELHALWSGKERAVKK